LQQYFGPKQLCIFGPKQLCIHNHSKYLELSHQLMFLIYVSIQNVLIKCVFKIVLDCQPTTIKLFVLYVDNLFYFKYLFIVIYTLIISNISYKKKKSSKLNKI